MKKFAIFLIALFCAIQSYAGRTLGGDINIQHTSGTNYFVTLTLYEDTIYGIDSTSHFYILDANDNQVGPAFLIYLDSVQSGTVISTYPYVVKYVFTSSINTAVVGEYTVAYICGFRDPSISNISNPNITANVFTAKFVFGPSSIINTTPVRLSDLIFFAQDSTAITCNPTYYDIDGDSLSFEVDTPLDLVFTDSLIFFPCVGYTTPPSDITNPFRIDAATGQIDWTPDSTGSYVFSILIHEFRSGVEICLSRMDVVIVVDTNITSSPRISNWNSIPTDGQGHSSINIYGNNFYSIDLDVSDSDIGDSVSISAFGEPFLLTQDSATFEVIPVRNDSVIGRFSWTPDISMQREKPYMVVFRINDGHFSYDYTLLINVVDITTNINNNIKEESFVNIYPNPTSGNLTINAPENSKIEVLSINGTSIKSINYNSNISDLSDGIYLVKITTKKDTIFRKIVKN